jgi:hypothetical protein
LGKESISSLIFGVNALLISITLLGIALFPRESQSVIVVAWPGKGSDDAATIVARAKGSLLRAGSWAAVVLATSDEPDFSRRLYASGAFLVLNGGAAEGCGPLVNGTWK